MTYKQLVTHFKEQAQAAGCASFWYGKETAQDINYDAPFPQAYLFMMPSTIQKGKVVTRVRMLFIGNDAQDSSNAESLDIQDAMDSLSQKFVAGLDEESAGEVGDVDRGPVMRKGSTIGTGFLVAFTFSTIALPC
jgi:hypothetical protein